MVVVEGNCFLSGDACTRCARAWVMNAAHVAQQLVWGCDGIASTTSGPIPSPGSTTILAVTILTRRVETRHARTHARCLSLLATQNDGPDRRANVLNCTTLQPVWVKLEWGSRLNIFIHLG